MRMLKDIYTNRLNYHDCLGGMVTGSSFSTETYMKQGGIPYFIPIEKYG